MNSLLQDDKKHRPCAITLDRQFVYRADMHLASTDDFDWHSMRLAPRKTLLKFLNLRVKIKPDSSASTGTVANAFLDHYYGVPSRANAAFLVFSAIPG